MTEIHRYQPSTERQAASLNAVWSSIIAVLYDALLGPGEVVGVRRRRRVLPSEVRGHVVEIAAGTSLNVARYPGTPQGRVDLMRDRGFTVDADEGVWRGMPAIVHPLAVGRAFR